YNKDVFAFPGNIGQSYSEGCNNLIKSNKAHLISSIKDLEYIMNWDPSIKSTKRKEPFSLEGYEPDEQHVLKTLLEKNGQMMIDELSWATTLPISLLASTLLGLEFKGVIQSLPGKKYKIVNGQ
ncbi:MAG TPA: hypothetical protein VL443_16395, partial [Cyclobacteriaceae bacterium]|nr:hypothetical protein [Cyclobacteriaceae bacterium]